MIGDAHTVRETADDRENTLPKETGPFAPIPLSVRLAIVAIFLGGCLLVVLPSFS
jgi:hypothetical protein